jgi:integrase
MATIQVILDTRRIKKDKSFPVVIRVHHSQKYISNKTNIQVHPKDWDPIACKVSKSNPNHQKLNHRIKELDLGYENRLLELQRRYPDGFSYEELKSHMLSEPQVRHSIKTFWEQEIAKLEKVKRFGNARTHRISLTALDKITDLNIPFERMNYTLLRSMEENMQERGLKTNSIGVYMRNLRVIFNLAIKKDVVNHAHYPFCKYKIRSEKVVPHSMSLIDLRKYFNYQLNEDHPLYKAWLMGKLSFLLCGINFIDLALLTPDSIRQDRIVYKRSKTKKLYSIFILEETRQILEELRKANHPTLLGILSKTDLESGPKLPYIVREKNKQFNMKLAKLSHLMGLDVVVRSYTFRYSIANLCRRLGYDISMISELLGHNHGSPITVGYLEAFDKDRLDAMVKSILDAILNNSVNYKGRT